MNNLIKYLITFAIGAASGSGITYILVKKKFEKKADDEIAEMKEYYDHHALTYEELVERGRIADDRRKEEKKEDIPQSYQSSAPKEGKLVRDHRAKKAVPIDYTTFYRPEDDTDPAESEHPRDDDDEEVQKEYQGSVLTEEHQQAKHREPRIIKHSDFGSEPHYTTQTLIYYTEDDILTLGEDQSEEEVADFDEIESMIGDALTKYGFVDNDEDHIYVRNDQRCCDYEIVKVFGSFYDGHPE